MVDPVLCIFAVLQMCDRYVASMSLHELSTCINGTGSDVSTLHHNKFTPPICLFCWHRPRWTPIDASVSTPSQQVYTTLHGKVFRCGVVAETPRPVFGNAQAALVTKNHCWFRFHGKLVTFFLQHPASPWLRVPRPRVGSNFAHTMRGWMDVLRWSVAV